MATTYEGVCAHCGKQYRGHGAKYCSYACRAAHVYNRAIYTCIQCGKSVNINATKSLAKEAKYCSKECKLAATQLQITCLQCGKIIYVPASRAKYTAAQFCSMPCANAYRSANIPTTERICEVCGKAFIVRTAYARKTPARFCSYTCMGKVVPAEGGIKRRKVDRFVERECKWCHKTFKVAQTKFKWIPNAGTFCSAKCRNYWTGKYSYSKISKEEQAFADMLSARGLVFEQQAQVEAYGVDILFREQKIAVEFDGDYWHSLPHMIRNDARKDACLVANGYRVVRVPESLYRSDPIAAVQMVLDALAA